MHSLGFRSRRVGEPYLDLPDFFPLKSENPLKLRENRKKCRGRNNASFVAPISLVIFAITQRRESEAAPPSESVFSFPDVLERQEIHIYIRCYIDTRLAKSGYHRVIMSANNFPHVTRLLLSVFTMFSYDESELCKLLCWFFDSPLRLSF